jgi:adenylate cyclase
MIISGTIAGVIFVMFSDGFHSIFPFINGAVIGFLLAAIGMAVELFVFDVYLRRTRFYVLFLSRTIFFLILVISVAFMEMIVARMIRDKTTFVQAMQSPDFIQLHTSGEFAVAVVYILAFTAIVNFTRQMNRKLGTGVLINFVTGRYYHPTYKERIIMFMRILYADEIVQGIGRLQYHAFIKSAIFDISEAIIRNKGSIYEYVEDEVVISWPMQRGMDGEHCIRTYFEARKILQGKMLYYKQNFGFTPEIKAAIHSGKVIRGEIGDVKSQIVFHGDVMNTTSRILDACVAQHSNILATGTLLQRLEKPTEWQFKSCGKFQVRGREQPVDVYSITEI